MTHYARLRPERHRYWPECYHGKWYPVHDGPPDRFTSSSEGEIWIETPWKEAQSVYAAEFELVEKHT